MKRKPISKAKFTRDMRKILADPDFESAHGNADSLMCNVLESLGYTVGVKLFKEEAEDRFHCA